MIYSSWVGEKEHFLKWQSKSDAYPLFMELLTKGQMSKLHKINLKQVENWLYEIYKITNIPGGRGLGLIRIPNDPHGRYGIPLPLGELYPRIPIYERVIEVMEKAKSEESFCKAVELSQYSVYPTEDGGNFITKKKLLERNGSKRKKGYTIWE